MSDGHVENWDDRDKDRSEHDACNASCKFVAVEGKDFRVSSVVGVSVAFQSMSRPCKI